MSWQHLAGQASLSQPLFASVGQASARIVGSLTWSLLTSLLAQRLVLLGLHAHCSIFWDLPGDVPAAPELALCGWIGVLLLSLSLSRECLLAYFPLFVSCLNHLLLVLARLRRGSLLP